MANRTVFVDLGDTHGPLVTGDVAVNHAGIPYALQGDTTGILSAYATLAAAIADTANIRTGQFVLIDGGDSASAGFPNADKGVWRVTANNGAGLGDYTKVMDGTDKAAEVAIADAGGFFAGANAEAALQEIGTKQVFYKRADTSLRNITASGTSSTAWDAAISALVIDNGSFADADALGSSTVNGIVTNVTFGYQIPVRKALSRDIISDGNDNEVYARLTHDGTNYVVSFYSNVAGVETAFNLPNQAIDLGYVLASMDFMKLPAFAGVTDSEFFGDEAGAVGTLSDEQIVTNSPAFTGLLVGMATQEAVNIKVDSLGLTGAGEGASLIAIEDAAGNLAATNVEAAIAELWAKAQNRVRHYANIAAAVAAAGVTAFTAGEYVIVAGDAGNEAERGVYVLSGNGTNAGHYTKVLDISHTAAELLIADAGNKLVGTNVEAALDEIMAAIGGTSMAARDYSSNVYVADNDDLVTAIGKLDAAIGALAADRLVIKTLVADGAIAAATNGPRLVGFGSAANDVSLLDASAASIKEVVGFATGADYADNAAINQGDGVVITGILAGFTGLTPGAQYYANPASAGGITATVPSTVGHWIVPVGVALNATTLLVRIGEPNQVVVAEKTQQVGIHFKSTAGAAGGVGETGYAIAPGDLWIDNDASVQNPTKSGTGKFTVYVCTVAWTGSGAGITSGQIASNFAVIGKQN